MSGHREALTRAGRVVVKLGTNALTHATGRFHRAHFEALAEDLVWAAGRAELVVVSSGAVALGMERLGWQKRPRDIPGKQAAAAVGQSRLVQAYEEALGPAGRTVAQVLLTHDDVQDRRRYLHARAALRRLIDAGVIPIINENDTVSVDELRFGDNDALAGVVAGLVEADLLVILSDVEGLFTADPRQDPTATRIPEVVEVTSDLLALAGEGGSGVGTGGMRSKLLAASRAASLGVHCVLCSGQRAGALREVLAGAPIGTHVLPREGRRRARTTWITHALHPRGVLHVDQGAMEAVRNGRSLLPGGLVKVDGAFERGAAVDLAGPDGRPFARGLVGYPAAELRRLCGRHSADIEQVLGYRGSDEVVHRDDAALLDGL